MENKRTIPSWLNTLMIICLSCIIICNAVLIVLNKSPWGVNINYVATLNIFACTPAIYYCLSGYKKNAAKSFLAFCIVYAITELLKLLIKGMVGSPIILIPSALVFGCMSVFSLGQNLGKKKSYILASIVVGMALIDLVYILIVSNDQTIIMIQNLILSICFFIMVYAKYVDKDLRNTN